MKKEKSYDQIVYLLQGGGALGSYQVGVCEKLLQQQYVPNWIIGTSIGAINGAIIAGNLPQDRIPKLKEFWSIIISRFCIPENMGNDNNYFVKWQNYVSALFSASIGQPGFFRPRLINPWFMLNTTPDHISFYDTSELRETLQKVINFDLLNKCNIRLSLGAVHVESGADIFFDNVKQKINVDHVMASCALPPGFPAVKIGNEYYWDGGLSSNTPFKVVLEEKITQKLLCFFMNLFTSPKQLPATMFDVLKMKKEIMYVSRHQEILRYFCELHFLQHTIEMLSQKSDELKNNSDLKTAIKSIADLGHPSSLSIVHFQYDNPETDLLSSDYNFSESAFKAHLQNGYQDAKKALEDKSWLSDVTDETGVSLHEY